jgi:hypothetical protein
MFNRYGLSGAQIHGNKDRLLPAFAQGVKPIEA